MGETSPGMSTMSVLSRILINMHACFLWGLLITNDPFYCWPLFCHLAAQRKVIIEFKGSLRKPNFFNFKWGASRKKTDPMIFFCCHTPANPSFVVTIEYNLWRQQSTILHSLSYPKKDWWDTSRQSFFWYNGVKDLKPCFLMTQLKYVLWRFLYGVPFLECESLKGIIPWVSLTWQCRSLWKIYTLF